MCSNLNVYQPSNPPKVFRDENVFEEKHGYKIKDPYRWLEDPDSEQTKDFVQMQNTYTNPYLDNCVYRCQLKSKLTEMWNYCRYSCPFRRSLRYFYFMNSGLQDQSVLYMQDSLDGKAEIFFDPNTLSEDGTISLSTYSFSEDGEIFAYGLSRSGSDWISIHFKNVATREDYPEILEKVKFSGISWTHDNLGVFYGYYPEQDGKTDGSETTSNENQKLYYHKVGTLQKDDILAVEFPDHPKWRIGADVSDCGKYLILTPQQDCRYNLIYFSPLPECINTKLQLIPIVRNFNDDYEYLTNEDRVFVFRTNKGAPNYRLIKIDFDNPQPENWTTLVPEHKTNVLDWAACVNEDKLVLCYISDIKSVLQIHSLTSGNHLFTLPLDIGTVAGYSGKRKHDEMFYLFTSFLSPSIIYHLDFTKYPYEPKVFRETEVTGFDPKNFEAKQVFYTSKDETKIPMFIIHRKDTVMNGDNATLLYGYGGFNISIQPYFSISRILFMESLKGIIAIPNIRGGGEYGEAWHNGGRLLNKQNGFDDFQSAAEYLIHKNYTTNRKIIIQGGSNGGLLVGACMNQRPDLFGIVISQVGVMDLLRFHKFTIGYAWCSDYGNPEEKEHFENILKFSPLHNVKPPKENVQYPATLLLTADHDDRVVPLHSYKFIAELQHTIGSLPWQKNPLMIKIDTKAGHGGGKPTSKIIDENIDVMSFIINVLDLTLEF
ncbi:UNVERIFIED_CONTAM: hypothetical protein RMT77_018157 [Armadillidium vulgare]